MHFRLVINCMNKDKIHFYPYYDQNDRKATKCKDLHFDMTSMIIKGQKYYNSSVSIYCLF